MDSGHYEKRKVGGEMIKVLLWIKEDDKNQEHGDRIADADWWLFVEINL